MKRVCSCLAFILIAGFLWAQEPAPSESSIPDSTRLEPIKTPKPHYPDQARDRGLQGRVVIRLHVDEQGKVESTDIVSGDPVLAKAAADAFKKWKFRPFIRNGKPVKVSTELPFLFTSLSEPDDSDKNSARNAEESHATDSATLSSVQKIRISSGVAEGQLIHKVQPIYPPEAKRKGIEGTVLLQITIGKDGLMKDVKLISGPPELVDAAIGAVQQWRYTPYLLQGNPVEVESTVKVTFRLR
jgi:TonB family protein